MTEQNELKKEFEELLGWGCKAKLICSELQPNGQLEDVHFIVGDVWTWVEQKLKEEYERGYENGRVDYQ